MTAIKSMAELTYFVARIYLIVSPGKEQIPGIENMKGYRRDRIEVMVTQPM